MSEKLSVSCYSCDAEYKLIHDLDAPYVAVFCAFCGDELPEDEYYGEEDEE